MYRSVMLIPLLLCALAARGFAQTRPATAPDAEANLNRLRARLQETYEAGDVKGLLQYLHPDVIVIFPDGKVLEGRQALVDYMDKMLKGPGAVVASYAARPVVDERNVHGDAAVSRGHMNDSYTLADGAAFKLDSVFTTTVVKTADGPADTGGWVVRDFHSSTDAFDNPVLHLAVGRTFWYTAMGAAAAGLVLGALAGGGVGWLIGRRRARA